MEQTDPGPERIFILSLGGSFNPVHCQHVRALELAREALSSLFPNYSQFVGLLAVAPGGHVRNKVTGEWAMKLHHRIAMANLCSSDWIESTTKAYGSAMNAIDDFILTYHLHHARVVKVVVVGGDRANVSRHSQKGRVQVFISRKGDEHKAKDFRKRSHKTGMLFSGMQAPPNCHLSGNDIYIEASENQSIHVSSTAVRETLKGVHVAGDGEKKRLLDKLVANGSIAQAVADYILEHEDNLYEG